MRPPLKNFSYTDRRKQGKALELTSLFEFSKVVNSSLDLSFILGDMLLTVMGKMLIVRGVVLLRTTNNHFRVANQKGLAGLSVGSEVEISRAPKTIQWLGSHSPAGPTWVKQFHSEGITSLFPLSSQSGVLGLVGLGDKASKEKFSAEEVAFLDSLFNISSTAIEKALAIENLRQANRKLDLKIQELNTLFELSKEFNAVLDAEKLIKLLIFSLMGQVGVSRYVLFLREGTAMKVSVSRFDGDFDDPLFLNLLTEVSTPTKLQDIKRKSLLALKQKLEPLGVKVLIPMQIQNEVRGILCLGDKMSREEYSDRDLEFLYSLGNLAIISLENARLFKEAIEKQRLEDELLIAREIQKGLLPRELPQIPGFEIAATNISSKQVGGDYYDAIPIENGRYVLAIGDVSGKGTPASLLMANLQATIRALVPLGLSMSELTKRVNNLIYESTGTDRFITFFWAMFDPTEKTLTYVNAGHNPPYLVRADGSFLRLEKGGLILGIMSSVIPYEEEVIRLQSGDLLVAFTDGVSEAMSKLGEEYGEPRLEQVLKASKGMGATDVLEALHQDVKRFVGGHPQSDDITLLVLKAL